MKRKYNKRNYKKPYNKPSYRKSKYTPRRAVTPWRPEMKYFDTAVDTAAVATDTSWASTEVALAKRVDENGTTITNYTASAVIPSAVGTGYGQIIGGKYFLKQIRVRGHIEGVVLNDQDGARVAQCVRIIMVMDENCNGSQAQGEDIFTDFGVAPNIHSFLAMGDEPGRFKILADKIVDLQGTVAATDNTNQNSNCVETKLFSMFWKPKTPIVVSLKGPNASTPAIAQLQSHNIFLLCMTNGDASTATISFCARCYYYD